MDKLNYTYIAKELSFAKKELENMGYGVSVCYLMPKKDACILKDEIVVQVDKKENDIVLKVAMFKRYI